ncbi:MAG: ral stress protein [Rhodocyclales bacterium]|nr:ral stress protein [Rhodocyclales bacterium]
MKTREEQLDFLYKKVEKIQFGMLSTIDPRKGIIRSRPMTNKRVEPDGTLWFMTSDEAATSFEVNRDHHVNISYAEPADQLFISVSGLARIVHDKTKVHQLWHALDKAWFPRGVDDSHIVLIRVDIIAAEYWDSPSSKIVELYELAKSITHGKTASDIGEHAKLNNL